LARHQETADLSEPHPRRIANFSVWNCCGLRLKSSDAKSSQRFSSLHFLFVKKGKQAVNVFPEILLDLPCTGHEEISRPLLILHRKSAAPHLPRFLHACAKDQPGHKMHK